ncbi:MAG: diacylglycerol kinase family protein [Candidatus Pacebacteria bacterium]|jgi:undecaprenol kinase|nr:diacylglycerol kinase family protein [Candidatus Paceibacterota bacterium]
MKISFKRLVKSFFNAFQGIKHACSQQNFFLMILLAMGSILLGYGLQISYYEWLILIVIIGLILSLEMFNTVAETTLDLIEPNLSPEVKKIKDVIAGTVLVACCMAVIVGGIIFIPKILIIFHF